MSETDLQKTVVAAVRFNIRRNVIFFHCPNGEYRSKRTGARLKAMGVLPGVPDLTVIVGSAIHFLELKTATGRQTPEQKAFQLRCEVAGIPYAIARTPEEAAATLYGWKAITTNPLVHRRAA